MSKLTRTLLVLGVVAAIALYLAVTIGFRHRPDWHTVTKPHAGGMQKTAAGDATLSPAGNGRDQADDLQGALNSLQPGQRLILQPGSYVIGRSITVSGSNVLLSGYGATLVATSPDSQAIVMQGENATLAGLTLRGTGTTRSQDANSAKVVVNGKGVQVLDVTIMGGASAGIFVSHATDVAIAGANVQSTLADGIHITGASARVLVQQNTVMGTGDDMVSVVSYQSDGDKTQDVLVTGNTLSGNYWGRGVSVVGGNSVTISGNAIQGVQKAAGVMVAQDDGYRTYDASNVIISDNVISDIEDAANPVDSRPAAQHAAIDLNTGSGNVTGVSATGNRIARTGYDGFRALGNVCQFRITDGTFSQIAGSPLSLQARSCPSYQMFCGGNQLDGVPIPLPLGCSSQGPLSVSGANVDRMPQIRSNSTACRRSAAMTGRP